MPMDEGVRATRYEQPLRAFDEHKKPLSRSTSPSPLRNRDPSPRQREQNGRRLPAPEPSNVLGIFGLSHYTRQRDLEEIFSKYGPIKEAMLVIDRRSGQSRGFGFIYFEHMEDAAKALRETNGMRLDGRMIRVDYSATQRAHSPTPGVYMGERRERVGGDIERRERFPREREVETRRVYRSRSPPPPMLRRRSRSRERYYESRDVRDYRAPREYRDPREMRDPRDMRDMRDMRDVRDPRDMRDPRDVRDPRDMRDPREMRDYRDVREFRDFRERRHQSRSRSR